MTWETTESGRNQLRATAQTFAALDGTSVEYGWTPESENYPNGDNVVERAAIHHFGTDRIPARPILSINFERNLDQLAVTAEALNDQIIASATNDLGPPLRVIGQFAVSNMVADFLRAQEDMEPLAESTITQKGFDTRLIETNHMREQVRFRVNL